MAPMAAAVQHAVRDSPPFALPQLPLVDGSGRVWRPGSDREGSWLPTTLREYTLNEQITSPYQFGRSVGTALIEYDPDVIVLLGPGASLGGAIGQAICSVGWRGITSKHEFASVQQSDQPLLITSPAASPAG